MVFEHASKDPATRLLFPRDQAVDSPSNSNSVTAPFNPDLLEPYHFDGEYTGQEERRESEAESEEKTSDGQEEHTDEAIRVEGEGPESDTSEDRDGGSDEEEEYHEGSDDFEEDLPPLSPPVPDYQNDVGSIPRKLLARSRQDLTPNPWARTSG
jgi:hypothetical protein